MFLVLAFWLGLICEESLVSRLFAFWDESPLFGLSSSAIFPFLYCIVFSLECIYRKAWR